MIQDNTVLTFGKYKNQNISFVVNFDRNYLVWLSENAFDSELREIVKNILDKNVVSEQTSVVTKIDNTYFKFGKFRGKTYRQVYRENPRYFNWVIKTFTENTDLVDSINIFLNRMKPISKRLNKIIKFYTEREKAIQARIQLEKYISACNDKKIMFDEISNLDMDKYYIYNTYNGLRFLKIKSLNIDNHDEKFQLIGLIHADVELYNYDCLKCAMVFDQTISIVLNSIPSAYNFDFDIMYRIGKVLYNTNCQKITMGDPYYDITKRTVRIMSDVWDDVYTMLYKGDCVISWCEFVSSNSNSISVKNKYIVCELNDESEFNLIIRMKKIKALKDKIK